MPQVDQGFDNRTEANWIQHWPSRCRGERLSVEGSTGCVVRSCKGFRCGNRNLFRPILRPPVADGRVPRQRRQGDPEASGLGRRSPRRSPGWTSTSGKAGLEHRVRHSSMAPSTRRGKHQSGHLATSRSTPPTASVGSNTLDVSSSVVTSTSARSLDSLMDAGKVSSHAQDSSYTGSTGCAVGMANPIFGRDHGYVSLWWTDTSSLWNDGACKSTGAVMSCGETLCNHLGHVFIWAIGLGYRLWSITMDGYVAFVWQY